jgi:hypothetical protein
MKAVADAPLKPLKSLRSVDPQTGLPFSLRDSANAIESLPEMLLELRDPSVMTEDEQQTVWTLLLYIKRPKKKGLWESEADLIG